MPDAFRDLPVVVVGAGFSGTLLAINLLRLGAKVTLVERNAAQLAKGLAFGTRSPEHLLNVRAANMSAYPDDATHFLRWLGATGAEQANRFVPRLAYGHYLHGELLAALAAAPGRLHIVEQEAMAAEIGAEGVGLTLGNGARLAGGSLVLALGNFPPAPILPFDALPPGPSHPDPWAPEVTAGVAHDEAILLLGTGLTAVDVALSLIGAGHRGAIIALSRRGLVPRAHAAVGPAVGAVSRPAERGSALVRALRRRASEVGWRAAVDELRPHTQNLWRLHDDAGQRRFLRHLRPWWDVHRHRLAPPVAARVGALQAQGRLRFVAGKPLIATPHAGLVEVVWRTRGADTIETVRVERIINCTGPDGDVTRATQPLVRSLLAAGAIRPDRHHLGLDVDRYGRVTDARGASQPDVFAVGPMTKGEAWEIVAVPDIRRQVWDVARYLTNSHWVAEGL